jgi:PAS domain S-box-containing protein
MGAETSGVPVLLESQRALAAIARDVAALTRTSVVAVWRADDAVRSLTAVAVEGEEDGGSLLLATLPYGLGGVGWVAANRLPLEVPDVFADGRFVGHDWRRSHGLSSFLGAPLVAGDRLLGVLALDGRRAIDLTAGEREQLGVLVTRAAAVLWDAHRDTEVHRHHQTLAASRAELALRMREMDALVNVARVVVTTTELAEALRLICRELAKLTGADTVGAYLLDHPLGEVHPVAGYHVPDAVRQGLADARMGVAEIGFRGPLFDDRQVVWTDDAPHDPRFVNTFFKRFPHRSCLLIPLVVDSATTGAFHLVWWTSSRRFDEREVALLHAIGQQASVLVHNARLLAALQKRAARLQALTRLNQLVSSSLDLSEVLTAIARSAAALTGAPIVSFWLIDEASRTLTLAAFSEDTMGRDFPAPIVPFDQGGIGWVATHRCVLVVDDVFADERFIARDWWSRHGIRSFYAAPILLEGVLHAVVAANGREPFRFDPADREALDSFCHQAALAIRNAALFERTLAARAAAESSDRRYRQLIDRSLAGVFRARRDGTLVESNEAWARMLGYASAEEVLRLSARDLLADPGDWDRLLVGLGPGVFLAGLEVRWCCHDGSLRWGLMNIHEPGASDPDAGSLEAIVMDISDRKRAEEAERRAEGLRAVTRLANAAAHEINNPLAVIVGRLEVAAQSTTEPLARHRLDQALTAAFRIMDIVERMNRIIRLEDSATHTDLPPMLDLRRSSEENEPSRP